MRRRRPAPVIAVLVALAVATALTGPAWAKSRTPMSLLFTLSGASATMTAVAGSADRYDLAVTGVDPSVVWFSDRPKRRSGVATLDWFTAQWDAGNPFAADSPNAAIVLHTAVGETDTVVVELRSLTADEAARTITARVRVLGDEEADELTGNLTYHGGRHDAADIPPQLGAVSLFVDPEVGFTWGTGGNGGAGGAGGNGGAGSLLGAAGR